MTVRTVVYDHPEDIIAWAEVRIPHSHFRRDATCLAIVSDGEIRAAVVFDHWSRADARAHIAAEPGGIGRDLFIAVAAYAFVQARLRRLSFYVASGNQRAAHFATRLGAQLEGILRDADADGQDYLLFGLLARDAANLPWVRRATTTFDR